MIFSVPGAKQPFREWGVRLGPAWLCLCLQNSEEVAVYFVLENNCKKYYFYIYSENLIHKYNKFWSNLPPPNPSGYLSHLHPIFMSFFFCCFCVTHRIQLVMLVHAWVWGHLMVESSSVTMVKIEKINDNKCSLGCEERGNLPHRWCKCTHNAATMKISVECS